MNAPTTRRPRRRELLQMLACGLATPAIVRAATRTRVRLGNTPFLGSAAVYAAIDRRLFEAEGLDVELVEHAQGWHSLKGVLEGTLDLGLTASLPIAYSIVNPRHYTEDPRHEFAMLADLIVSQAAASGGVGRRDLGVNGPLDLRGKRVAVPRGTTLDLYLDLVLTAHGMTESELTVVDLPENQHLRALLRGDVAASFSFRHTVVDAMQQLGDRGVPLTSAINFTTNWVLVARRTLLSEQPRTLQAVLRALDRASVLVTDRPVLGREILVRRAGLPAATVDRIWGEHLYRVQLPESLARNLETQMRWILRRSGRALQTVPDLLDHLGAAPMMALWPQRVTIAR